MVLTSLLFKYFFIEFKQAEQHTMPIQTEEKEDNEEYLCKIK